MIATQLRARQRAGVLDRAPRLAAVNIHINISTALLLPVTCASVATLWFAGVILAHCARVVATFYSMPCCSGYFVA